jgi:proton glutamate symport protein
MPTSKRILILVVVAIAVVALLGALEYLGLSLPDPLHRTSQFVALFALVVYAVQKRSLTTWILVSMSVGIAVGYYFPETSQGLNVFSKAFLKLIKASIAPLLFATLVVGIAGHSNMRQLGRMGWKSLLYFEVVTTIALFIGIGAINLTRAGEGVVIPKEVAQSEQVTVPPAQSVQDIILHIFPENIAKSVTEGQILQIVVFSLLFGVALAFVKKDEMKRPMLRFCESLSETMFKFVELVMYLAPLGVGAAMAYTVGHMGLDVLVNLFQLLGTLYIALIFFVLAVLLPVALIARINIPRFLKAVQKPASIAFATTSSEAALPSAMERMVSFGVPRHVVAFVMPTGYSFNLDGTTLYLALASVFVAQAAGIEMSFGTQMMMVFTLMLTSKGVAGVPRASLIILLGTAAQFGLPTYIIFAILGIDELMDMGRTTVNVVGNCLASAVIARWEGVLKDGPAEEAVADAASLGH